MSIGLGLTTGDIFRYLAMDLGASGLQLSWILAAPPLAGMLRLAAPAAIRGSGGTKRFCLAMFGANFALMLALPVVGQAPRAIAIQLLIMLACTTQLCEALGWVAYWTWWGDIVPLPIRGRYFGCLQTWRLVALIPMLAGGCFADQWIGRNAAEAIEARLLGYAIPNAAGVVCLLASLIPLALVPGTPSLPSARLLSWRELAAPWTDGRFRPFLTFRGWFALANGITQTVQSSYPKQILGFRLGQIMAMSSLMRCGQAAYSPWAGRLSDRRGNRPVLTLSQTLVALSMALFIVATPQPPGMRWLLVGAYVLWSAYAGHNICLPNLALKLAPDAMRAEYIAAQEAIGSLVLALATLAGGRLFDLLNEHFNPLPADAIRLAAVEHLQPFMILFAAGLAMRLSAVWFAGRIQEPGSWNWLAIWRGRNTQ